MDILLCLYKVAQCYVPHLCKQGIVMNIVLSPERGTRMKCLSSTGIILYQTWAPKPIVYSLASVPYVEEKSSCDKTRVEIQIYISFGLSCVHAFVDTVKTGPFQTLGFGVCAMAILPWLEDVALGCFFLLWKRRNSPAKEGFSTKDFQLGVPFMECKLSAWNNGSKSKRQSIALPPTPCRRMWVGPKARISFLSIVAFGLLSLHFLIAHCKQVASNLSLLTFAWSEFSTGGRKVLCSAYIQD